MIGTADIGYAAEALAQMMRHAGPALDGEARTFEELASSARAAFARAFVRPDGKLTSDTQTAYAVAIALGALPADARERAGKHLVAAIERVGTRPTTGVLGTAYLLPALSLIGRDDLAYQLLLETNPATHYAFGGVGEWMYDAIGGIALDPRAPAGRNILVRPRPGGKLTHARARYDSLYGPIATDWRQDGRRFHLKVSVPANSTATVTLPYPGAATESGVPLASAAGVKRDRSDGGRGHDDGDRIGQLRVRRGNAVIDEMSAPAFRTSTKIVLGAAVALVAGAGLLVVSRSGDRRRRPNRRRHAGRVDAPGTTAMAPAPPPAPPARLPPAAPAAAGPGDDRQAAVARSLIARLAELYIPGRTLTDEERSEIAALEARLVALGDVAIAALIARLDGGKDAPGARELMFNVLRRLPGEVVERRLVAEAKRSQQPADADDGDRIARRAADRARAGRAGRHRAQRSRAAGARADHDAARSQGHVDRAPRRDRVLAAHAGDVGAGGDERSARGRRAGRRRQERSGRSAAHGSGAQPGGAARGSPGGARSCARRRRRTLRRTSGWRRCIRCTVPAIASLAPLLEGIAARDRDAGVRVLAQQLLTDLRR